MCGKEENVALKRKFNRILALLSVSILVILSCCSWTVSAQTGEEIMFGEATIKHNGKVSAVLTIENEEEPEASGRDWNLYGYS